MLKFIRYILNPKSNIIAWDYSQSGTYIYFFICWECKADKTII